MAPKPPVEKLPLAARKNLRDEYESKKADHEKEISTLFGETWTIDINVNQIYAYAEDDSYAKQSPGACLNDYVSNAVSNLKKYVESYGDDGKADLNTIASKHVLTMEMTEDEALYYCGSDIKDGFLRIVFKGDKLGTNVYDSLAYIEKAISSAPHPTEKMNLYARQSIKEYESGIAKLHKEITEILNMPNLVINPRFEENYAALSACTAIEKSDWEQRLGSTILSYISGWRDQLNNQGFKGDDMLQEGFQEGVPKGIVEFRVVKTLNDPNKYYHWAWIDDGVFVIEAKDEKFGTNVYDTGANTLDLL